MRLFSGQGKVYLSAKDGGGDPVGFAFLGNVSNFDLKLGRAAARFATGGGETPRPLVVGGAMPEVDMTLDEFSKENLAKVMYGSATSLGAGTGVTDNIIAKLGYSKPVANPGVTFWNYLKNSLLTVTYTEGVDYTVNRMTGMITFPATGSAITDGQSLYANYSYGAYEKISAFTIAPAYYWLRFDGINTVTNTACIADIFKVKLLPVDGMGLINDTLSVLRLLAKVSYDATRANNTTDGRLFRIIQV